MKPIAVWYHCLFQLNSPDAEPLKSALEIVHDQMQSLKISGLEDAAKEIHIGVNGGEESKVFSDSLLPRKAKVTYHGLNSHSENLTLVMLENWVKDHQDWIYLYFHAKGCTHVDSSDYASFAARWRRCMMRDCVTNWRTCVADLETYEAVGSHWLTGLGSDKSQHYFAGNFYWARASFLATIPSIFTRDRIKQSGIASLESRYEAEVILGNGPRLPTVKSYATHAFAACP